MTQLTRLTQIQSIEDHAQVTVAFDSDYVMVYIGGQFQFARSVRKRSGEFVATMWAAGTADQVREVAGIVATPALIAWLLDCGFVRVN